MTLGSLFDGIGGFPLAAAAHGIRTLWVSDIDPACETVTRRWFPDAAQLGDITQIDGTKIKPVDIITGGSPCQDLSVAGKRAGLEGVRSGLFVEMMRIVREMRGATDNAFPRYVVWENVPGAFSSNGGEDFRVVVEEFCRCADNGANVPRPADGRWAKAGAIVGDGFSLAWRTLDAKFWGVPQRRRRIYLVADFGGERAPEILFKPEGLRGHTTESRTPGQGAAGDAEGSAGGSVFNESVDGANAQAVCYPIDSHQQDSRFRVCEDGICPTVPGQMGTGGNNGPMVMTCGNGQLHQTMAPELAGPLDCMHDAQIVLHQGKQPRRYIIRRLTPLECCRLQGFPDGWTDIPHKGKPMADSARYRMLGNSVAVPCVEFVMGGIAREVSNG